MDFKLLHLLLMIPAAILF